MVNTRSIRDALTRGVDSESAGSAKGTSSGDESMGELLIFAHFVNPDPQNQIPASDDRGAEVIQVEDTGECADCGLSGGRHLYYCPTYN